MEKTRKNPNKFPAIWLPIMAPTIMDITVPSTRASMGTQVHTAISATMATGIRMPLATHMRTGTLPGTVPGTLPKRVMEKQMRTLTPRKTEFLMHGRTLCMGTEVMDAMAMDMAMHHIGLRELNKKYEILLMVLFLVFFLFLASEALLFISFFWASFHSLSSPSLGIWPGE